MLKTMSIAKNIVSRAEIEKRSNTFGIYDLSEFLSVLSLVDNPYHSLKTTAQFLTAVVYPQ